MLISEDRCSSAMVIEVEGVREHIAFDDIGCMLDYEQSDERTATIIERYLHDYDTRAWVTADTAWLLKADRERLSTPMGSGMVAFGDRAAADRARAQWQGDVVNYRDLLIQRAAAPNQPPGAGDSAADDASGR
jgi:hypothetical protein